MGFENTVGYNVVGDRIVYSEPRHLTRKDRMELIGVESLWLVLGIAILLISGTLFSLPEFSSENWVRVAAWILGASAIIFSSVMIFLSTFQKPTPLVVTTKGVYLRSKYALRKKLGRFLSFSDVKAISEKSPQKPKATFITQITEIVLEDGRRIEIISQDQRKFAHELKKAWKAATQSTPTSEVLEKREVS
ncbi:MAG: hypothetical protein KAW84_04570 [Thermoplasmata archaeon]|nr:hypothetical protein [Thermoplasmata archaeon]